MKNQKSLHLLPSVDKVSSLFWKVLTTKNISATIYTFLLAINFTIKFLVSSQFSLLENISSKTMFGSASSNSPLSSSNSSASVFSNNQTSNNSTSMDALYYQSLYANGVFLCFQMLALISFIVLLSKKDQSVKETSSSTYGIICLLDKVYYSIIYDLCSMILLCLIFYPLVNQSTYYQMSKQQLAIHAAISSLQILIFLISFGIHQNFLSLKYNNSKIILSIQNKQAHSYDLIFDILLALFALKLQLNFYVKVVFILTLALLSMIKIFLQIKMPIFYNRKLSLLKLNFDIILLSVFLASFFEKFIQNSKNQLWIIFGVFLIFLLVFINYQNQLYQKKLILTLLKQKLKTEEENEYALCLLLDEVQSSNISKIIVTNGYFGAIDKHRHSNASPHSYFQNQDQLFKLFNNEIESEEDAIQASDPDQSGQGFHNYFDFQTQNNLFQNVSLNQALSNHKLEDCFGDENSLVKKEDQNNEIVNLNRQNKHEMVKMEQQSLQKLKITYLIQEILTPILKQFPQSINLMFLKSLLSIVFLKNRFICLTIVTNIETLNQAKGYFTQICNKISQQYLLDLCLAEQSKVSDQIDSNQIQEYNLKITNYLSTLHQASLKIHNFWSLLSSASQNQVHLLEKASLSISESFRKVKAEYKEIENDENLMSMTSQVHSYSSLFYSMALRDFYTSEKMLKKIQNTKLALHSTNPNFISSFDDISLSVVDGNFSNMGKIVHANKTLLKKLQYQAQNFVGRTVHVLMPRDIAEVHDLFWNRFKVLGIPSVLEQQRFLFVKSKDGYVAPFKIFIKFMYHQTFGYSFLGVFKQIKSVVISEIERPLTLSKTFSFLVNPNGKVVEISKSCVKIIGLSQMHFEALSSFLEDGLRIHHFNSDLSLQNFFFNQNQSSVFLSQISFDTTILSKHNKELDQIELAAENENRGPKQLRTQVKIVKETYGLDEVTLYYYIFSLALQENLTLNISHTIKSDQASNLLPATFQEVSSDPSEEGGTMSSAAKVSYAEGIHVSQSVSETNTQSCSSTLSGANKSEEMKYLEETIDYSKTPRALLIVKIAFLAVIFLIFTLGVGQIAFNKVQRSNSLNQLDIIMSSLENQLFMSQLQISMLLYSDIQNNLSAPSSNFIPDRTGFLVNSSLIWIEKMRNNYKSLDFESYNKPFMNELFPVAELQSNHSIQFQNQQLTYSINEFLVKLQEFFITVNYSSPIFSFLYSGKSIITEKDMLSYFVIQNSRGELENKLVEIQIQLQDQMIERASLNKTINQVYFSGSSFLIMFGMAIALYFYLKVFETQRVMMAFFSQISANLIDYCQSGSKAFSLYMESDLEAHIIEDNAVIEKQQQQVKQKSDALEKNKISYKQQQAQHQSQIEEEIKEEEEQKVEKQNKNLKKTFNMKQSINDESSPKKEKQKKKKNKAQKKKDSKNNRPIFELETPIKQNQTLIKDLQSWRIKKTTSYSLIFLFLIFLNSGYFTTQYILNQQGRLQVLDQSEKLKDVYQCQSCINNLTSSLRLTQRTNSTQYISTDEFNDLYQTCQQSNVQTQIWLKGIQLEFIQSTYSSMLVSGGLCDTISANSSSLNHTVCNTIYNGLLSNGFDSAIQVILHDTLQMFVNFVSSDKGLGEAQLRKILNAQDELEMIDAQLRYLAVGFEVLVSKINSGLASKVESALFFQFILFGIFTCILVLSGIILNYFVFAKIGKSIWNSKIVFKLLPFDQLDENFKKNIVEFMKKS